MEWRFIRVEGNKRERRGWKVMNSINSSLPLTLLYFSFGFALALPTWNPFNPAYIALSLPAFLARLETFFFPFTYNKSKLYETKSNSSLFFAYNKWFQDSWLCDCCLQIHILLPVPSAKNRRMKAGSFSFSIKGGIGAANPFPVTHLIDSIQCRKKRVSGNQYRTWRISVSQSRDGNQNYAFTDRTYFLDSLGESRESRFVGKYFLSISATGKDERRVDAGG